MLPDPAPRSETSPSPAESDRAPLELALAERVRDGDTAAFETLFTAYYEPLLRYAVGYVKSRPAAEEMVQDVFLTCWVQREQWQVEGSVKGYLYAMTRNRALNWLRRGSVERRWAASVERTPGASRLVPRQDPADQATRLAELDRAIRAAVDRLPPRCREAFQLSREHQLSYEQIAETMGTSVKTVQEQIGRALRALRLSLADWVRG
jgi:RNA polymerase sigma-70 factor, ECF subfamily